MHLDFFGLRTDPFRLDQNLDFVYVSKSHEETIAHLVYGLEQGEDFVLITGAIGTGKTLALHFLLDQIVNSYRTAFVNVTTISFLELLKLILDDLGIDFETDWDRADLLSALKKYLHEVRVKREKILVVVDEAQNLDMETLEGLRLLSNLSQPGKQALQIILAGQPGLVAILNNPKMEQLKQRIRVQYQLEVLSRREVEEYIKHRMKVSGCSRKVFKREAIDKISKLSGGVPRLVNQFAGQALLGAFVEESRVVKVRHVEDEEVARPGEAKGHIPETNSEDPQTPSGDFPQAVLDNATRASLAEAKPVVMDAGDVSDVRMAEARAEKSRSRRRSKGWFWAAVLVLVLAGGLYGLGSWDWLKAQSANRTSQRISPQTRERVPVPLAQAEEQEREPKNLPAVTASIDTVTRERVAPAQVDSLSAEKKIELAAASVVPEGSSPSQVEPEPEKVEVETRMTLGLHVASFRSDPQARRLLEKLKAKGMDGIVKKQVVNGATWYRIYLGPFADRATASRIGQQLKDQKIVMYYRLIEMDSQGS